MEKEQKRIEYNKIDDDDGEAEGMDGKLSKIIQLVTMIINYVTFS
jgi:hypothetical protein